MHVAKMEKNYGIKRKVNLAKNLHMFFNIAAQIAGQCNWKVFELIKLPKKEGKNHKNCK